MDINNFNSKSNGYFTSRKLWIMIVVIILLIACGIGGYFYWINSTKSETKSAPESTSNTAEDITDSATKGVLPSLQTNPLEDKPDVNPADKANPFKDIKTNPF